mmetsp:Transcript_16743/g.36356  ORF Transcript_16743/g.36356 Transcript_16743/m.36356 type:complete len:236 (-) Transcript_16743:1464-2171(-)
MATTTSPVAEAASLSVHVQESVSDLVPLVILFILCFFGVLLVQDHENHFFNGVLKVCTFPLRILQWFLQWFKENVFPLLLARIQSLAVVSAAAGFFFLSFLVLTFLLGFGIVGKEKRAWLFAETVAALGTTCFTAHDVVNLKNDVISVTKKVKDQVLFLLWLLKMLFQLTNHLIRCREVQNELIEKLDGLVEMPPEFRKYHEQHIQADKGLYAMRDEMGAKLAQLEAEATRLLEG